MSTKPTIDFLLADIGEGIAECELLQWFVKPGDRIEQFTKVCEVQSDKANVEITSRYDGVVRELKYKKGEMCKVGSALISLEVEESAAKAAASSSHGHGGPAPPKAAAASASSTAAVDHSLANEKALASPAVRRIAKENSMNLALVRGTGPAGRILKEDVLNFLQQPTAPAFSPVVRPTSAAAPAPAPAPAAPLPVAPRANYSREDTNVPITGLQRIMVQTMTAANAVPTFGYADEVVMDELTLCRHRVKALAEKEGVKISYLPFIIKATSLALRHFPQLNAHVNADCSQITMKGSHNIGLAMDTSRGLLVPNIKNVQDLSVLDIARELHRLTALGKAGKLGKEDLTGGTFTLSNVGTIGGTYTSPLLVVPEVVIGALGKIQTLPRYDAHLTLKPQQIMVMSWSADHRVVDGATMARFSNLWKSFFENPYAMLLETK